MVSEFVIGQFWRGIIVGNAGAVLPTARTRCLGARRTRVDVPTVRSVQFSGAKGLVRRSRRAHYWPPYCALCSETCNFVMWIVLFVICLTCFTSSAISSHKLGCNVYMLVRQQRDSNTFQMRESTIEPSRYQVLYDCLLEENEVRFRLFAALGSQRTLQRPIWTSSGHSRANIVHLVASRLGRFLPRCGYAN